VIWINYLDIKAILQELRFNLPQTIRSSLWIALLRFYAGKKQITEQPVWDEVRRSAGAKAQELVVTVSAH
jgi:hypothetical protein